MFVPFRRPYLKVSGYKISRGRNTYIRVKFLKCNSGYNGIGRTGISGEK